MAAEEGARWAEAGLGAWDAAAQPPQRGTPPKGAQARWSPQQSPDNRIRRSLRSLTDKQRHSGRWHRESLPASWVAAGEPGPQVAGVRVPSPGGSMSSRRRRLLKEASQSGSAGALPLGGMRSVDTPLDLPRKELAISWVGVGAQLGGSVRQTTSFRLPQNERVPQRPEGATTVQEELYPQQPCSPWPSEEYTSDLILDPMEHEWMLIVAEGQYDSIIGPLTADPSLLSRRDFVTGYSALHWLAKHGRHEDLIQLMQYAEAHGLPAVDINARASGGFTPLHIAAMQGHEMLIKLLVGAFGADVHLRDHSGRKAWQYLPASASTQLKELSGALEEVADLAALNKNNNSRSSKRAYKRVQRVDEVDGGRKIKSVLPATISPFMNLFRRVKLYLSSEW